MASGDQGSVGASPNHPKQPRPVSGAVYVRFLTIGCRDEVSECRLVHIVNEHEPTAAKCGPDRLHLESHVPLCMKAVVNEEVDRPQLRDERPEVSPTRASDICPSVTNLIGHRYSGLAIKF